MFFFQILQQSHAFRTETIPELNEKTLMKCIDINRCILYGLLKPSNESPRILNPTERTAVLNLQNFDNLSLAARYYVINSLIEKMEKQLQYMPDKQLQQKDEYDRTLMDTLNIYKILSRSLSKRLNEINLTVSELMVNDEETVT